MALATQCPHCHTTFRVASDQLKLRGGIVRCGACQRIFDGSAHLVDLEPPVPAAPPPAPDAAPFDPPAADAQTASLDAPAPLDTDPHPVSSQPMQAAAAPLASGRPQVWRSAARPTDDPPSADAEQADAAATAVAEAAPPIASMTPAEQAPAAGDDAAVAAYAPADRVEPHLEPLYEPLQDVVAEPEAAAPPAPAQDVGEAPEPVPEFPAAPASAHSYAPPNRVEPSFDLPPDEEIVAPLLADDEHEHEPAAPTAQAQAPAQPAPPPPSDIPPAALPLRASAVDDTVPAAPAVAAPSRTARSKALEARTRRSKLTPTKIEPPRLRVPQDDVDEPEFVKRSRRQESAGRTRRLALGLGTALLLLVLLAQAVTTWRDVLAARSPAAKPVLEAACALLGCRVALPAQAENITIETGELATLGPGTYSLNTLLRNQGSLAQAWPSIELELTDDDNKPVLRRVFGPAEYLPRGATFETGFGPRSEQPVRLHFALNDVPASDYHLFVFYP